MISCLPRAIPDLAVIISVSTWAGSGLGVPSPRRSGGDSRTMRSKGCLPSFARSQAQMSSSSLRTIRSRKGRGAAGECLSAQLPSPVAPIRYHGVSIACSTCCALTTPSSFACSAMPRLPRQFPGQSPWQTKSGQGTDAQLLGRPFLEQYGSLFPVGNR